MKRLVWLLLVVFGTALAQVPAVTMPAARHACHCCQGDGSCGMPDCLPPPVSVRTVSLATSAGRIAVPEVRVAAAPAHRGNPKFYSAFMEPTARLAPVRAPDRVTLAASVPLFAAHCSFLL